VVLEAGAFVRYGIPDERGVCQEVQVIRADVAFGQGQVDLMRELAAAGAMAAGEYERRRQA